MRARACASHYCTCCLHKSCNASTASLHPSWGRCSGRTTPRSFACVGSSMCVWPVSDPLRRWSCRAELDKRTMRDSASKEEPPRRRRAGSTDAGFEVYVDSAKGDDKASGAIGSPLRTIHAAVAAVRSARSTKPGIVATMYVHAHPCLYSVHSHG